jgi:hypothetical protein
LRSVAYDRAAVPHAVWQIDASEYIALATGQRVSWLRVIDECSGAVLQTVVFPLSLVAVDTGIEYPRATASDVYAVGNAASVSLR